MIVLGSAKELDFSSGTDFKSVAYYAEKGDFEWVYDYFEWLANMQAYINGATIPLITYGRGVAFNSGACLLLSGGVNMCDRD